MDDADGGFISGLTYREITILQLCSWLASAGHSKETVESTIKKAALDGLKDCKPWRYTSPEDTYHGTR